MKNKKGFTLIELLAVIVILAVIALIATPIILNMINNAKQGAAKDSAYGYIDAIEKNNALANVNENYAKIEDGIDISVLDINKKVTIKGTKPSSGNVTISKGIVTNANLCINNFKLNYNGERAEVKSDNCNEEIIEINASDVSFTPSDSSWNVSTVEEALDYLYK